MLNQEQRSAREAIPGTVNLVLSLIATTSALGLLWFASHAGSIIWYVAAIIAFSFINNTIFSLLHEAVHGIFHSNRTVNEWAGRVLAAFFPTGFALQRIAHLGHHRRNRTDAELFDYYRPGENVPLKFVQWYGILSGLYWLLPPFSCLLFLVTPTPIVKRLIAVSEGSQTAHQTSAEGMLLGYKKAPFARMRLEILFSILFQLAIVYLLDLSLLGWLGCYAAFGFNWSSLQYTDHAFSERAVYDGAWNLKVNKVVQYLFLNYHHHLAHHQHPTVPWLYLERYVDLAKKRPTFLSIYLKMWAGPRPLPEPEQTHAEIAESPVL